MTTFQQRIIDVATGAINNKPRIDKFNHASLICHKGKIVSIGINNQYKTHTLAGKLDPEWSFIHAELDSLIKFKRKTNIELSSTILYNVRLGKSGRLLMSMPCINCAKLIIAAGFKRVFFTNNLGLFEEFKYR